MGNSAVVDIEHSAQFEINLTQSSYKLTEKCFNYEIKEFLTDIGELQFNNSILLHFQPSNTGFYPLNKSDIFTCCYFHTVKISKVLFPKCENNKIL